ncbi:DUF2059 domain-containing protein [Cognatiluteimonas profundi]|uniref:DUF2059 domain-containing protein n=1 Tax=Cognatiluteimonas profundi TaxID=2594501 RepID=UPI00131EADFB|nr:DUF2059 domain-containing protein [Lysobacter profundi]
MKISSTVLATCLLLLSGVVSAQQAPAQQTPAQGTVVDPQKVVVIHQLLEVTGAVNVSKQVMSRLFDAQKKAHPEIDAVIWDRLAAKMNVDEVQGELIKIYDRHFSTADLQATLAFYQSAAGQRMLKELPAVMSEAMTVGQAWGQRKTEELRIELQNEKQHPTRRE